MSPEARHAPFILHRQGGREPCHYTLVGAGSGSSNKGIEPLLQGAIPQLHKWNATDADL